MKIRTLADTPFAVDVLPFRRRSDRWEIAVVAKATYAVERAGARLLKEPIPVFAEERRFDDAAASLYAPRDLVPLKTQPEVVVVGAQPGATIRLPGRPAQPIRRPPVWPPAGAGPGAPWHVTDIAASPLGDGFDGTVFQYAPLQQRLDALSLSRPIVLAGASTRHPTISLIFPPIEPVARIESLESTARAVVMTAELVWVDVDRGVCTVTWRGTTDTDFADGVEIVVGSSEGGEIRWPARDGRSESAEPSWHDIADDDSVELPTDVAHLPPAPPSDTYTGAQVVPSVEAPAWLAPAGGRAAQPPSTDGTSSPPLPSSPPPAPPRLDGAGPSGGRPSLPHPARDMLERRRRDEVAESQAEAAGEPPPRALALDVPWWDEACADLVDREPEFESIIDREATSSRAPTARDPWWDDVDDDVDEEASPTEQLVLLVMREGSPTPLADLGRALMQALETRRRATAPLRLVQGELKLGFDPRAALEVYVEAARPLAKSDKALAATLDHVDQLLASPLGDVAEVARGQRVRIAKQWRLANRDLPVDFLEQSASEILLQRRAFEKRDVLDEPHVRTLLVERDVSIPLYLPEPAGKRLPLFHAFHARIVAELWPRQDEREPHAVALRAIAVARML